MPSCWLERGWLASLGASSFSCAQGMQLTTAADNILTWHSAAPWYFRITPLNRCHMTTFQLYTISPHQTERASNRQSACATGHHLYSSPFKKRIAHVMAPEVGPKPGATPLAPTMSALTGNQCHLPWSSGYLHSMHSATQTPSGVRAASPAWKTEPAQRLSLPWLCCHHHMPPSPPAVQPNTDAV